VKKRVLFKESLCIVNRIKGDGESHLSLANVSPGHSCVAPTGEKGFHIHCCLRNPKPTVGNFSIKQSADIMCIQTPIGAFPIALLWLVLYSLAASEGKLDPWRVSFVLPVPVHFPLTATGLCCQKKKKGPGCFI